MKTSSFSLRLTQAMNDAGLRASDLSRICGINKSTMSQYISGKYEAKRDRIIQISRALGCSPDWLAGEDVPMTLTVSDNASGAVPVLREAALGEGDCLFFGDAVEEYETAELRYCDGHHFIFVASDDGMDPLILEGDHVLCVRQSDLLDGQTGLILLPDGTAVIRQLFRRKDRIILSSCNRYYPERSYDENAGLRIVGRVVRSTRYW